MPCKAAYNELCEETVNVAGTMTARQAIARSGNFILPRPIVPLLCLAVASVQNNATACRMWAGKYGPSADPYERLPAAYCPGMSKGPKHKVIDSWAKCEYANGDVEMNVGTRSSGMQLLGNGGASGLMEPWIELATDLKVGQTQQCTNGH